MARKGLPAKYAKMGFARGWRAYKASKAGGRPKRRSPGRSSNPGRPKRSGKRAPRARGIGGAVRRVASPKTIGTAARLATQVGTGIVGAAAGRGLVDMLPLTNPLMQGLAQMGVGLVAIVASPRRGAVARAVRIGGVGSAFGGGMRVAKTLLPQFAPLLSGTPARPTRIPYYGRRMGINFRPNGSAMGANLDITKTTPTRANNGRMQGYGARHLFAYQ